MPYTVSDKRYDVPGGTSFEPNGGIAGMWSYITGRCALHNHIQQPMHPK